MAVTLNASTSTGYIQTADTSGDLALQSNGTTQFTVASTGAYGQLKSGTAVASTSGTSIDFTSIPSWVKRITVMFQGVSTNGTSVIQMQVGAGSATTTGYAGTYAVTTSSTIGTVNLTSGFGVMGSVLATDVISGAIVLTLLGSNTWTAIGNCSMTSGTRQTISSGSIALSGTLDRVRITTVNGTDTFDAGSINILYEG